MNIKDMSKRELKVNIEITKRLRKALIKREEKLRMEQTLMEIKFMQEE